MTTAPSKGRPSLGISLREILEAVRAQSAGHMMRAARDLTERDRPCSARYIYKRFVDAGLDLARVLAADDVDTLLDAVGGG